MRPWDFETKSRTSFFLKRFEPTKTGRDISEFYSNTFTRRGGLNGSVKKPGWDEASKLSNTHLEVAKKMFHYIRGDENISMDFSHRVYFWKIDGTGR